MHKVDTPFVGTKMVKIRNNSNVILLLLVCVQCSLATKFQPNYIDFEQIKHDLYAIRDFNISNVIREISSDKNWSGNRECLLELTAIRDGFEEFEEWAVKLVDAWGKVPSGIMSGNFFELGSFKQCFEIERNFDRFETQYCLAQLKFHSNEQTERNTLMPRLDIGPSISIGICIPAVCSVDHLESLVNKVIQKKASNMTLKIPRKSCQFEENATDLKTLDFAAIGLLGTVAFLMVICTGYDVFSTIYGRTKYRPFMIFSIYTNTLKLFTWKTSESPGTIQCLNGIRVIATLWVLLEHNCTSLLYLPLRNAAIELELVRAYRSMIVFSAPIAVDTFFVLSGLLVSFNLFMLRKRSGKLNIGWLYFHRFLRVTPLLGATLLFSMSLLRFLANGPVWPIYVDFTSGTCERYWWASLLFIQNYVNPADICYLASWYLSADTQLFLIAPLLIYLVWRFGVEAFIGMVGMILASIGFTLVLHVKYNLTDFLHGNKMELAYVPTHIRWSPWLIGFMAGYVFYEFPSGSIRIPKQFNRCACTISSIAMLVVIFGNYPFQQPDANISPLYYGLYDVLSRIVWSMALCYVIFACVHNSTSLVNRFLSHPIWQPISRLSFSIYLVQPIVLVTSLASIKTSPHFNEILFLRDFIGNCVISIVVATFASLAFESPIVNIEKLVFRSERKSESSKKSD